MPAKRLASCAQVEEFSLVQSDIGLRIVKGRNEVDSEGQQPGLSFLATQLAARFMAPLISGYK